MKSYFWHVDETEDHQVECPRCQNFMEPLGVTPKPKKYSRRVTKVWLCPSCKLCLPRKD